MKQAACIYTNSPQNSLVDFHRSVAKLLLLDLPGGPSEPDFSYCFQ